MSTFQDTLKTTLTGDAALMALLTGGITDADNVKRDGGSATDAPYEANGITLKPHMKIRYRGGNRRLGERVLKTFDESIELYIYQDRGYGVINQARDRVIALLDDQYFFDTDDRTFVHLLLAHRSDELTAPEYNEAPMKFIRFNTVQR